MANDLISVDNEVAVIQNKILTIRGVQILLDRDLAVLYGVNTKVLNQAVKRNIDRFPERFMFQLDKHEYENWKSQIVTSNLDERKRAGLIMGLRRSPYAFTEQGVAMLSTVLRSAEAVQVSIRIMDAFVMMRKLLSSVAPMLSRLDTLERRQITDQTKNDANQAKNEERFNQIFDALGDKDLPLQKIFFNGQVYDAKIFATKHILSAKKSILLIDNWVDSTTLEMLSRKASGVAVEIVTSRRGNHIQPGEISAFNTQYGGLSVRTSPNFHDRFVIIDDKVLYLFGASLKDLGKKCIAFTRLDPAEIPNLKARI